MTEKEILFNISNGDIEALSELYISHSARIRKFAFCLVKSQQEAEDVAHNVFLKLWENREKLPQIHSIQSYLFQITKNMIYDSFREKIVYQKYKQICVQSPYDDMEGKIYANDFLELIDLIVDMMPNERKAVYLLSRNEGLSYKEISDKLGISPKTVQYHISMALNDLRKVLMSVTFIL